MSRRSARRPPLPNDAYVWPLMSCTSRYLPEVEVDAGTVILKTSPEVSESAEMEATLVVVAAELISNVAVTVLVPMPMLPAK